jgi:hypothetical protein
LQIPELLQYSLRSHSSKFEIKFPKGLSKNSREFPKGFLSIDTLQNGMWWWVYLRSWGMKMEKGA